MKPESEKNTTARHMTDTIKFRRFDPSVPMVHYHVGDDTCVNAPRDGCKDPTTTIYVRALLAAAFTPLDFGRSMPPLTWRERLEARVAEYRRRLANTWGALRGDWPNYD